MKDSPGTFPKPSGYEFQFKHDQAEFYSLENPWINYANCSRISPRCAIDNECSSLSEGIRIKAAR